MIRKLEHYNIRTMKFDETVRFYVDALGMRIDRAPMAPVDLPPTWIYDDSGVAVVHLTPVDAADPKASYAKMSQYRGGSDFAGPPSFHGSGAIDHVAFECEGYDEIVARLKSRNITHVENDFSQYGLRQVFVRDPNGVTLELNFRHTLGNKAPSNPG